MMSARTLATAVATMICVTALTACGGDDESSGPTGSSGSVTIDVTEENGEISPHGDTVEVPVGSKVHLNVESDAADEIHVHSEPEHEFEVKPRDNQVFTFSIDTPGTYEVESHELEVTIAKLQVS